MRKIYTGILVTLIVIIGLLGITNPARRQPFQLFDKVEGKVIHNYFIFSIYQQYNTYRVSDNGQYREYKRYIGIAMNFYEISPIRVKQE
jgi:hypothetical protein